MVDLRTAENGVLKYIENELLSKLTGAKRVGATVYVALASRNMDTLLNAYKEHPAVKVLGVLNGDEVDVDALYNACDPVFRERVKMDIPLLGEFEFNHDDIVKLAQYMKGEL